MRRMCRGDWVRKEPPLPSPAQKCLSPLLRKLKAGIGRQERRVYRYIGKKLRGLRHHGRCPLGTEGRGAPFHYAIKGEVQEGDREYREQNWKERQREKKRLGKGNTAGRASFGRGNQGVTEVKTGNRSIKQEVPEHRQRMIVILRFPRRGDHAASGRVTRGEVDRNWTTHKGTLPDFGRKKGLCTSDACSFMINSMT